MNERKRKRRFLIVFAVVAVSATLLALGVKYYVDTRPTAWSLITPPECVDAATKIAELRTQGRFDEAVDVGLHSLNGRHDDFIYQMIADTYLMRSAQETAQGEKWAKLGAEYSEKAQLANPGDVANVFNAGWNYVIAGDDIPSGGCEYYRKALSVFQSLTPKLQGDHAEAQGRTISLRELRKQEQERLDGLKYRLRRCETAMPTK